MGKPDSGLPDSFTVGEWTADSNALSIACGDAVHQLEPRAFGVLRYLAERPRQLVTIDELMDALWPGVVVTPNAVTRVIAQLRKALGDEAKQPRYIQTVARTGYRLMAPVRIAAAQRKTSTGALVAGLMVALIAFGTMLWMSREAPANASVAVLPFANLTGDPSLDYLGDGVAEEIIDSLATVPGLKVSARSLSFRFRDTDADPRQFAEELGVAYLVEGSVRRSERQLRITAQLISADSGFHVWSRTVEHDVPEMFEAQDEISTGVAAALIDELDLGAVDVRRIASAEPHPKAYELYLRGRYIWHRRGTEPMQAAIDNFAEAVNIDPDFTKGWAALASAYLTYPSYSPEGHATWKLAEVAARKAIELDPDIAEVYGVLATFAETRLEWVKANALFLEGMQRDPHNPTVHFWYSEHLAKTGRYRESIAHLRQAQILDPTYLAPRVDFVFMYLLSGEYEKAVEEIDALWEQGIRNPTSWSASFIAHVLIGDYERARQLIDSAPMPPPQQETLRRFVDAEAGRADATALIEDIAADPGLQPDYRLFTWMASRLGAHDAAFVLLRERLRQSLPVDTRPIWGPDTKLREQPDFPDLLDELGLIDYWERVGWGDFCRRSGATIVCDAAGMKARASKP